MANVKISQLATATTLTGSEEVPVVQSGSTVKTTAQDIANLGGLGVLDIIADGSVGGPITLEYKVGANVPATISGQTSVPVTAIPTINFSGGGGYGGGAFTATTIELPSMVYAWDFNITQTTTLQEIAAPVMVEASGYNFNFYNNTALTTLDFPQLVKVRSFNFGNTPLLTNVNFPLLQTVEQMGIQNANPGITGFRQTMFPALRKASFNWGYNYLPTFELDMPLLTDLTNNFNGGSSVTITKINLPGVINFPYYIQLNNYYSLTELTLGTVGVTKTWGSGSNQNPYVNLQQNALTQSSVDQILTLLASLDGTNGTTAVYNGNVYLSGGLNASPSATGLAAVSTLQSRGFYVSTN